VIRHHLLVCAVVGIAAGQEDGAVKVTVARANVRTEASEKAPVLTQVTLGTVLTLKRVDGDWFFVELPPDARLGGARVTAYLSKKVATLVKAPAAAATPPAASAPASPDPAPAVVDGMSVAVQIGESSSWVVPHKVQARAWRDRKVDTLRALAPGVDAGDELTTDAAAGNAPALWIWALDGASSDRVLDDRRPSFIAHFADVPGVSPADIIAVIVRLVQARVGAGDARLVAAARGRADQGSRNAGDWDLGKELKQDVVRAEAEPVARGGIKLRPSSALAPGEYALVLRPSRKKLPGATVLASTAEGRLFGLVWDFTVK
jgi:hypothetical protein